MFMPVLSGLIVSVDAFFIGLSLGLQKACKFMHLVIINVFLFGLCIAGFFLAGWLYELIPFEPDLVVGFSFIGLGAFYIVHYFITERAKGRKQDEEGRGSLKTVAVAGFVMSFEAMLITMGIMLVFLPYSTFAVPITVALAHFGYSALSFALARGKYMKKVPSVIGHTISGLALITYGLMALFVDFGV